MISELVFHSPSGACEGHQRNSFVTPCECIRRHATSPFPTVPLTPLHSRHHRFPHRSTPNGANLLSCCFMACFLRSVDTTFRTSVFIFDISDFDSAVACSLHENITMKISVQWTFRPIYGRFPRSVSFREYYHATLCAICLTIRLSLRKRISFRDLLCVSLSTRRGRFWELTEFDAMTNHIHRTYSDSASVATYFCVSSIHSE